MRSLTFVLLLNAIAQLVTTTDSSANLLVGSGEAVIPVHANKNYFEGKDLKIIPYILLDDLQKATAISISDGKKSLTIVSVDTLHVFKSDHIEIQNRLLSRGINTELLINASHGHANIGRSGGQYEFILNAIEKSIVEANMNLAPAEFAVGTGYFFASLNRVQRRGGKSFTTPDHRFCDEDLGCLNTAQKNAAMMPLEVWIDGHPNSDSPAYHYDHKADPLDKDVGVVHFREPNGEPIATIFNYASHPVIVPSSAYSSADFPGYAKRLIENELGGRALFLQGFAGDIVPAHHSIPDPTAAHAEVSRFSNNLAASVINVHGSLTDYSREIDLQILSASIDYVVPDDPEGVCGNKGGGSIVTVYAIKINEKLQITAISDEPFVQLGIEIKRRNPLAIPGSLTLTAGYTNDFRGYIPHESDYGTGGYGTVPIYWMCFEPNTGAKAVDAIIELFGKMRAE